ncbi:MAG: DUF4230 domain-containing protein [Synergistaceae bacterium]|nr:DUF4230 domain-containing protein [Synergistaceae bacterium]
MGILITLLLVASVSVNVWLLKNGKRRQDRSVRSILLQGIRNVRELATIRRDFESVVIFSDAKSLLGFSLPGTGRRFILKYSGVLTCGSDLSRIKISERFAVNRVRMIVPHCRLLDLYADMKSVQVYDQRAGLFTSVMLDDQNREIAANIEEVRQETLRGDLLSRADDNLRMILTSLAASLGMEAEVTFEGDETTPRPTVMDRVLPLPSERAEVPAVPAVPAGEAKDPS